jgi:hypothetical protein
MRMQYVAPAASAATPVGTCPPATWDAGQGTGTYWVLSQQQPHDEDIGATTNYDQNGDGYICTLHRPSSAPRPGSVITDNTFHSSRRGIQRHGRRPYRVDVRGAPGIGPVDHPVRTPTGRPAWRWLRG